MDSTSHHRQRPGQRPERARLVQPETGAAFVQPEEQAEDLDVAARRLNRRAELFLVPADWGGHHKVEDTSESARARRLEDNKAQHLSMQLEGSLGRSTTWETTVKPDLWTYGVRVLPKKIITGEIFTMMAQVKGPRAYDLALPMFGPEMTKVEAHDLASDVVAWAVESFCGVLLHEEKGWRPDGGASFRTFFIGKCCHGFAGVYRKWLRQRARQLGLDDIDELFQDKVPVARDRPEQAAIINVQIEHYFEGIDDDLEIAIATLNALEVSNPGIANLLGVPEKVVEYRLKKNARGATRRWDRGEGETIRGNPGQVA